MMQYDVVVWRELLSDGSPCYAAVCPAVNHAHGQGDTEAEALADVADAIGIFLDLIPYDFVKTGPAAEDEKAELIADLAENGTECRVTQLHPVAAWRGHNVDAPFHS